MVINAVFPAWLRVYVEGNVLLSSVLRSQIYQFWPALRPFAQNRLGILLVAYFYLQKDILRKIAGKRSDFYKDFAFFRQKKRTLALAREEQQLFLQEEKILDELLSFLDE